MNRRRFTIAAAVLSVATLFLSACGDADDSGNGSEPITLEFSSYAWQDPTVKATKDIVAEWNAAHPNVQVKYIPVACAPRVGSSKIRARDFQAFLMLVLRTIVLFNPLKIFLPLGTFLFVVGVAKLTYDVFLWNLSETAVMAFLSAVIIWSVGLLADMISRLQLNPPRR